MEVLRLSTANITNTWDYTLMLTLTLIMVLKHLLIQEAGDSVLIKSKL